MLPHKATRLTTDILRQKAKNMFDKDKRDVPEGIAGSLRVAADHIDSVQKQNDDLQELVVHAMFVLQQNQLDEQASDLNQSLMKINQQEE